MTVETVMCTELNATCSAIKQRDPSPRDRSDQEFDLVLPEEVGSSREGGNDALRMR